VKKKFIGILAGMGPRSTAPFVDMVVTQCQTQYGAKRDEEFPHMMIYSLPVPFRLDSSLDHSAIRRIISDGLKRLESTDVDFIAMPCNAAHIYYDALTKSIDVPLLNMIDETLLTVPPTVKEVALFAARMTAEAGVYQRGIEQRGLDLILKNSWQDEVDRLILTIKSSTDTILPQKLWDELVAKVIAEGTDTILLACTDLNAISQRLPEGIMLIDATQCLAKAVVREYIAA
jgi:aspartate racemase